jgi:GTP-binding protein
MAVAPRNNPIVAIIGRANVGKSTMLNRLAGSRTAIVDDRPGTTRDAVYALIHWGKHHFWLADTAGFKSAENELEQNIREQITQVADIAQVIILVVDAGIIITTEDREAARLALKTGKPVILAVNKIDTAAKGVADDFARLGVKAIVPVSAIQGQGSGDLLDQVIGHLKPVDAPPRDNILRLALLGRPNVGKSSILNSLAGKQQAIVSEIAGTTRDVNTISLKYKGREIEVSDTAGLRRRGKIERGVEKFSSLRTLGAVAESDICILVIDANELAVAQDQHIAGMVEESGKGLILVVNKWDTVEKEDKTQARYLRRLQADYAFIPWAPVIFTSATQGLNVTKLFELATQIDERRQTKIATGPLNKLFEKLLLKHPPAGLKNRHPRINYTTQTGTNPPTFVLFGSNVGFLHFSYKRYLENSLREAYDFTGTPIILEYRDKHKDKEEK